MVNPFATMLRKCEKPPYNMALHRTFSAKAAPLLGFAPDSRLKRVLARTGVGVLALLLAGGVAADWIDPSMRPSLEAAVGRDVNSLLDSRSPGERMAGALLSKVKTVLSFGAGDKPGLRPQTPAGGDLDTRSRNIPPRAGAAEAPGALAGDEIQQLFGPLEGLEGEAIVPGLGSAGPAFAAAAPLVLIGGGTVGGATGGGVGGGIGGAGPAPGVVATTPAVPVAPVPEPATWLTMVTGFGMAGWALRRRRCPVKALAAR